RRSDDAFVATLDWALRWVLVITLPAAVGLLLLAEPLLATIFHGGKFDAEDVRMSAASLVAFAPGLIGFVGVKVLAPAYFARQDTRTPVRIGVRTVLLNLVLNVVLVMLLIRTAWAPAHAGLALATSISGLCNAGMLLRGLVSSGIYRTRTRWLPLFVRVAAACAAMAVFVAVAARALGDWLAMSTKAQVAWLGLLVAGAVLVYAGAFLAVGIRPRAPRAEPDAEDAPPAGPAAGSGGRLYRRNGAVAPGPAGRAVTIGAFDGLHLGHQRILAAALDAARSRGIPAHVVSFEPMPGEVLSPHDPPARLTCFRERFELLEQAGIDEFFCASFRKLRRLPPQAFIEDLLVARLGARQVVVGHDFRFGFGRGGGLDDLRRGGDEHGFEVTVVPPVSLRGERISSTAIRAALAAGDLAKAREMLGRDFSLSGRVVR